MAILQLIIKGLKISISPARSAQLQAKGMIQKTFHFFTPLILITAHETPGAGSSL